MKYIPDRWTNGPSATYEELVKLLGGPKGNATSNELEGLLARERKALVELGLDAKRPPTGADAKRSATRADRSVSATEAATSERSIIGPIETSIAGSPGALQTNKEC